MRLDERRIFDQLLSAEEPCIGAVFASYTFDPSYFEQHVLRSVLRLESDPEEDARRFHEEARGALQRTPVACIVDAGQREPGRRLPYDLLLARGITFHPKLYLLLFESEARLAIGSGNLTKPGIEQNTELFFARRLPYADPGAAELLAAIDQFLEKSAELAPTPGTQLAMVREALRNRIGGIAKPAADVPREVWFVDSFSGRLVDQLRAAIHPQAKVTHVGVLCPFFERDDVAAGDPEQGLPGVLGDLMRLRPSKGAEVDIAVPWEDAPLNAQLAEPVDLPSIIGRLCVWRRHGEAEGEPDRIEHYVIQSIAPKRVEALDSSGSPCRLDRARLEDEMAEGRFWVAPRPTVHAPRAIFARLASDYSLHLWLHPSNTLSPAGARQRRPLHAKVLLVTATYRGKTFTHALIGSPNASRAALGRTAHEGGNVEAAVLCRFDGEVRLGDILSSLVHFDLDGVALSEREFPTSRPDLSLCIESAEHDATARTLTIRWSADHGAQIGLWRLTYLDRVVADGTTLPEGETVVDRFDLDAASAELTLTAGGGDWPIPILVRDLAALPTCPSMASLGLRELLALLAGRVGSERLATVREQRGAAAASSALDAIFGEGFGPTDVFNAWWGGAEALRTAPTIAAFRHILEGATGLMTAWNHLREDASDRLSADERWVFGCELVKELRGVDVAGGADATTKRSLLEAAIRRLRGDLANLEPAGHAWLAPVAAFYGMGEADVDA
ncbi:MAG: hypothetical protein U0414_40390 [Polyangiaceae bacterium]